MTSVLIITIASVACLILGATHALPPAIGNEVFIGGKLSGYLALSLLPTCITYCLTNCLRRRQSYQNITSRLLVDRSTIVSDLSGHLSRLIAHIHGCIARSVSFRVEYNGEEGIDGGALRQQYIKELLVTLITNENGVNTKIADQSRLPVPSIQDSQDARTISMCKQLGEILMFCYHKGLTFGVLFDHSIFRVAFALTEKEIDTPFEHLSEEIKIRLYRVIVEGQGEAHNSPHNVFLPFLETGEGESDVMQQLSYYIESEQMASIDCRKQVLSYEADLWDAQLRAIHALASGMKGMHTRCCPQQPWGFIVSDAFDDKVQGTIHKQKIKEALNYASVSNRIVRQKCEWLAEWIQDQATTPDQIKKFLEWSTGAAGLSPETVIDLYGMETGEYGGAEFYVAACGPTIRISQEPLEKREFITRLESEIKFTRYSRA